jgi:hypothetical protein
MLNLLPKNHPKMQAPVTFCILDPSVYYMSPLTEGGGLGALVHSSLVDIMTLYFGLELDAGLIIQGYFREFPHFLVGRVLVIGRLLRLGTIAHCILVV